MLQRMWEPCAVLRYMVKILTPPCDAPHWSEVPWSGEEEDNVNGQKSGAEIKAVRHLVGRWTSSSLSDILLL